MQSVSAWLFAAAFAARPRATGRTFGYMRLEILAAVINAPLLFGVAGYVLVEAVRRFTAPPKLSNGVMLSVAAVGLVANTGSLLLRGGQQVAASTNCRATPDLWPSGHGGPASCGWVFHEICCLQPRSQDD